MTDYSRAALRWVEPLLALGVGGPLALRFVAPAADPAHELGIVPTGTDSFVDYPTSNAYVRELTAEELATLAGQFRQGAREVLLSHSFAQSVAAAQGLATAKEMFEAAAGLLIGGQICRIRSIKPLDAGEETYAWQLLCDAPLEAA
jgi:hypothetical protein